jgi:tetratricopeptide (TPR) repeat protein
MTAIPSETREELEKLERKHAENPEGRYFVPLANAFRKVGEVDRAMTMLRSGLAKHPDYLSAHIVLGRCLADAGELAEAEAEFRHVLSLDPQNLVALRTLGELATSSGKVDEARQWYRDLLAVDPMNEEARRALDSLQSSPPGPTAEGEPASAPEAAPTRTPDPAAAAASGHPEAAVAEDDARSGGPRAVGQARPAEADGEAPGDEPVAVVTETIAELYTRQGFYERAADVYHELIRRRGSDSRLEERLRRVVELAEAESQSQVAASAAAEPAEPQPAAAQEPGPAQPQPWWEAPPAEPTPKFGWERGPAQEETPVATIRDYLRSVVTWEPRAAAGTGAGAAGGAATGVSHPREEAGSGSAPFAWGFDEPPADAQRTSGGRAEPTDDRDRRSEEDPDPHHPGSRDTGSDEPRSEAGFGRTGPPASADPAPERGSPVGAGESGTGSGSTPAEPPATNQQDDDDLESFQEWLRSLKR